MNNGDMKKINTNIKKNYSGVIMLLGAMLPTAFLDNQSSDNQSS